MAGVVHFEIPTENKERANTFYQTAFNWNLVPMQGMDYTSAITTPSDEQTGMPSAPGAINGALFPRTDTLKTPIITIDVDDVDAALAKVESAGGVGGPGQGCRSRHGLLRLLQGHRRQHHGPLADGFHGRELTPGQGPSPETVTLYL